MGGVVYHLRGVLMAGHSPRAARLFCLLELYFCLYNEKGLWQQSSLPTKLVPALVIGKEALDRARTGKGI